MKKFLQTRLLLAVMSIVLGFGLAQADTYTYTFTSSQFSGSDQSVALGDATWTLTTDAGYFGFDQNGKGQQIGSAKKAATNATLSTASFADYEITGVTVNTSGASSINGTVAVKVGGTQWGETESLTSSATDYAFTGTGKGDVTIEWTNSSAKALYVKSITVEYAAVASNVATPTFTVEAGTYGVKQSVGIECATEGAAIYYTLDGTTPDNTATLYEAPIELNTNTTVKAIAYVGEEASNVASATYEFKLEGSIEFISPAIVAGKMQIKVEWTSEDWANNTVTYHCTLDGTVPSAENKWNSGAGKTRQLPMYTWKKDTVVNLSVRAELNGIYSDVFQTTVYCRYATTLDFYRAATAMEAGNYVMFTPATIARRLDDDKTYDYLPTVATTNNNGVASAFGYFEWSFETADGGYYIKDSKGRYIYMAGTYNNFNVSESVPTEGGIWTVSFNSDGTAQIMNVEKNKYIQYSEKYNSWGSYPDAQGVMPFLGMNATPKVVMTPELDGQTLTSLSEITFYCADGLAAGTKINNNRVRNDNYDEFKYTVQTVDDNTIKLVFEKPITASGSYTFSYASGSFVAGPGTFDLSAPDANKSIKFTIDNPNEVMVSPKNSDRLSEIKEFVFSNANGISVNALFEGEAPYLSYKNGEEDAKINLVASASTETSITLVPETEVTIETTYTLVVADGYFVVGEDEFEALGCNKEYILVFPITILSTTPAAGEEVSSFTEMIVEFNKKVYLDKDETYNLIDPAGNKTKMKVALIDTTTVEVAGYWNPVVYPISNKARFYVDEPLTAEGEYKAVLSEYGWEVVDPINTVYLDKTTITFNVKAAEEPLAIVSTTPADGAEVDNIYEVNVELNKAVWFDGLNGGVQPYLQNAAGEKVATFGIDYPNSIGFHETALGKSYLSKNLLFFLNAPVKDAGEYKIVIPGNSFKTDDNNEVLAETTINVTIAAKEVLALVSSDPADGAEVTSFNGITLVFNKEVQVVNALYGGGQIFVKDGWGMNYGACVAEVQEDKKTVVATFSETLAPEAYQLVISDNTIKTIDGSEALPATTIKFTVVEGKDPLAIVSTTPADGAEVDYIYEVNVELNKDVWFDGMNGGGQPYLQNAAGEKVATFGVDYLNSTGFHETALGKHYLTKNLLFFLSAPVKDAGEYKIVIPGNSFKTDDNAEALAETTINLTVAAKEVLALVSSDPASGAEVTEFNGITLVFNKEVQVVSALYGGGQIFVKDDWGVNYGACEVEVQADKKTVVATFSETLAPESYQLVISDNTIKTIDGSEALPATTIKFKVVATPLAVTTSTPAEGAEVESFNEMVVEFNKAVYVANNSKNAMLYNADGTLVANLKTEMLEVVGQHTPIFGAATPLATKVRFYADAAVATEGAYYVQIPTDMFAIDDNSEWNTKVKINFTIKPAAAPAITATWNMVDGATVETFSSVNITFAGEGITAAKAKNTYGCTWFYEKNADGEWQLVENQCTAGYMDHAYDGTTITLSLDPGCYSDDWTSPFNRKGDYRIVIPAGSIMFNGDKTNLNTEEYVLNFTIYNEYVEPAEVDAAFIVNPANNSKVSALKEMTLTFTDYSEITVAEPDWMTGANLPGIYMYDDLTGSTMPTGFYFSFRRGNAANQLVVFVDPNMMNTDAFNMAGTFVVKIPKKVVTFSDGVNKEIELTYTVTGVEKDLYITASDPENNAVVDKLESIIVDWNKGIATPNGDVTNAYIENVHGINVSSLKVSWIDNDGAKMLGNRIRYVLENPVVESGIYTLIIPAEDLVDFDTQSQTNEEERLTFTVEAAAQAPAVVATKPADGASVDALESIVVNFNIPVGYDGYFDKASIQDKSGKVICEFASATYVDGDAYSSETLVFTLDEKIAEANDYVFVLPAKTITSAIDWMTMMEKDFSMNITVGGAQVDDIILVATTPSDNSTVEELTEIVAEFNIGVAMMISPDVFDSLDTKVSTTAIEYNDAEGNAYPENIVRLVLNTPITAEGTYYVVFDAGSIYDYPNYTICNSKEYRIKIEVSSFDAINGIEMDPVNGYVVYDINGFRVMQTKKASDLDRLNNGLYIINGVKVLINK